MGKNLEQQESVVHHQHRSKCMWGIFHHLNHYRWNTVKKRLPYRKRATSKNEAVDGDPDSKATATATASEMQQKAAHTETENTTPIEAKTTESSSSKSKWMKSRLKSLLFTDEGSKRKGRGRHRRSSSCPTTEQTPHIATNPTPKISSTNDVQTSLASLLDPPLPIIRDGQVTSKQTCDLCIAMLKMNYLKQSEIGKHGLHTFEDHTLMQNRLIYAIEPTKAASLQESKLFLKALDLLNVRKEVFLKVLQDPSSSLAQQLHDRHSSNKLRVGLGKSMTFPSPGSRGDNVKCVGNHNTQEKNSVASIELNRGNGNGSFKKKMCTDPELLDNVTKHSEQKNKHGLRHFLRDKLRLAIKESRKERQRIVMDGVLDKIPRGRRMPKEGGSAPHFNSQFGKSTHLESMKRASSFHESPERYNQLLESWFHRESQSQIAEQQRDYKESGTPNNKTLERFMSLPDLRCYKSEDSQYDTCSVRTNTNKNNVGRGDQNNNKVMYTPTGSEYHTLSEANSDEILQDGFQDVGDTFDANITEPTNSVAEMNLQDTTRAIEGQQNEWKTEKEEEEEESPVNGLNILMDLHVDNKNKAQFDYVKDVLELSGFSGIEPEMLPLNPTLFDQVEGCLLAQPDCTGNEAGGTCDHLLLFDLINDVLLEMYERSFSYWPRRLTCHSYIRRMPVGYRVLEEVWANINWLLGWSHEHELSVIEDAVSHDLSKGNNWMNLQFDAECAGLELEELILDDLLDELLYDDLLLF